MIIITKFLLIFKLKVMNKQTIEPNYRKKIPSSAHIFFLLSFPSFSTHFDLHSKFDEFFTILQLKSLLAITISLLLFNIFPYYKSSTFHINKCVFSVFFLSSFYAHNIMEKAEHNKKPTKIQIMVIMRITINAS